MRKKSKKAMPRRVKAIARASARQEVHRHRDTRRIGAVLIVGCRQSSGAGGANSLERKGRYSSRLSHDISLECVCVCVCVRTYACVHVCIVVRNGKRTPSCRPWAQRWSGPRDGKSPERRFAGQGMPGLREISECVRGVREHRTQYLVDLDLPLWLLLHLCA